MMNALLLFPIEAACVYCFFSNENMIQVVNKLHANVIWEDGIIPCSTLNTDNLEQLLILRSRRE